MPWRLRFPDDSTFTLSFGTTWLGRDEDCSIQIIDPTVSRRHARLVTDEVRLLVVDPGSRNGTWLDGVRVDGATEIHHGGRLRLGRVEVAVEIAPEGVVDDRRRPSRLPPDPGTFLDTPALVAGRRQWFLEVQTDQLRRALARGELDRADEAMQNVEGEPELESAVSADVYEQLLRGALTLAVARDSGRWIAWIFEQLTRAIAPPRSVLCALADVPAPLCVRALDELDHLLVSLGASASMLSADERAALATLGRTADEARHLVTRSHAETCHRLEAVKPPSP